MLEGKLKIKQNFYLLINSQLENTDGDGYISEKIIEAFVGGTIPIYYGDYMIDEYINKRAYILIKSEKDIIKKRIY